MTANDTARIAILWDKSFLWGLIAYDTFRELGIDFDLLTSSDIRDGLLLSHDILFVPGGWASDKIVALGDEGREKIREFVASGGSYLGFCGGAGLALSHENGLGLSMSGRMPTSVRLPSFSGAINLEASIPEHPMWQDTDGRGIYHAWWPGQFSLEEGGGDRVLARYGAPVEGSYVTDLPVYDSVDWSFWEQKYGINLNPERIVGEPAVIETRFGEGKVILSYLHFETPGDREGHVILLKLLGYLADGKAVGEAAVTGRRGVAAAAKLESEANSAATPKSENEAVAAANELKQSAADLVDFGKRNFLWYQRNGWLLQWHRGVRGVEYSTLATMLTRLADLTEEFSGAAAAGQPGGAAAEHRTAERKADLTAKLRRLCEISEPFFQDARKLLLLERDALTRGPISPLKTGDEQIQRLRERLFSNSKRCGGLYEKNVELADEILLSLLRRQLG